jgi:preprotein translocase subunit YajC
MDYYFNLSSSKLVGGQDTATETSTGTGTPTGDTTQTSGGGLFGDMSVWMILLVYAIALGGYFIFSGKRNKKKEAQITEMRNSLKPGDSVCTTAGFFGKIADVGDDVFIVEFGTNKGVRVPVLKSDVVAAKEPVLSAPKLEN